MRLLKTSDPQFYRKLQRVMTPQGQDAELIEAVRSHLDAIAKRGDKAVLELTEQFDRVRLKPAQLPVGREELAHAARSLKKDERAAMREAIACIKDFHRQTLPQNWRGKNPHGATVGENFYPVNRVGLYVPGGQVPLVSTVLMTVIPARLAGVSEIAVCTPPRPDGTVDPALLAALHACGVHEVYRLGGIQAIGAMAFGTKTIPAVDMVAGPGNAYVMEAQRQVFGQVGVRLLPGPSEVMVIGDDTARPEWMAAELLAQAEHGTGKERVYLALMDEEQIAAVQRELESQLPGLSHEAQIRRVLKKNFAAILAEDWDALVAVTNHVAPEHLQVMVDRSRENGLAKRLTTAGAMLLGHTTPTVLGDFTAGPSHTLPTGRTGRFFGGLQATDFIRRTSVVRYTSAQLKKAQSTVEAFSRMEQLDAHGRSLERRLGSSERK